MGIQQRRRTQLPERLDKGWVWRTRECARIPLPGQTPRDWDVPPTKDFLAQERLPKIVLSAVACAAVRFLAGVVGVKITIQFNVMVSCVNRGIASNTPNFVMGCGIVPLERMNCPAIQRVEVGEEIRPVVEVQNRPLRVENVNLIVEMDTASVPNGSVMEIPTVMKERMSSIAREHPPVNSNVLMAPVSLPA